MQVGRAFQGSRIESLIESSWTACASALLFQCMLGSCAGAHLLSTAAPKTLSVRRRGARNGCSGYFSVSVVPDEAKATKNRAGLS